jgi:hypothetical protein
MHRSGGQLLTSFVQASCRAAAGCCQTAGGRMAPRFVVAMGATRCSSAATVHWATEVMRSLQADPSHIARDRGPSGVVPIHATERRSWRVAGSFFPFGTHSGLDCPSPLGVVHARAVDNP